MARIIEGNFGKVYIIDCIKGMKQLENDEFQLGVVDPPYNVNYDPRRIVAKNVDRYSDNMSYDEYKSWCTNWFNELKRITKGQVITVGNPNMAMWFDIEKPRDIGIHYKPNSNGTCSIAHLVWFDVIFFYGKFNNKIPANVIRANIKPTSYVHPCPKVYKFWKKLISDFNPTSVLDCFMGSGTTAQVCEELGIKYVGFEIDKRYIIDIEKRISLGISLNKSKRKIKGLRGYNQ